MATISLQCNSPFQMHSSVYFRLKMRSITGRAYYMGKVLTQVWLKAIKKQVNYLTNK